ncbi:MULTISPECIES: MauE/DoxX family redox-associated membrane protein [Gilvimarinus]|uniref:MauE/DoxX family redox-associated membrane protein n=1 Tax=Gilvimarinus TaxID=940550 RepID=UPI00058E1FDB|nr:MULTISPECIES: MauE/DoxX family redox-associated membrane protein [Gilvimarinus]UTF61867.1 glutaredoxin family protein [Gilvimarinus sp. DA14]
MHTDEHICPFGLKSRDLLKRKGYEIEDHLLTSREETESFKRENNVKTTPQTFIDGERIGGYDDLKEFFGKTVESAEETTYKPVVAIFAMTFLMASALAWRQLQSFEVIFIVETFIALSMCALAIQKLRDLSAFSLQFITYDLLAMRFVPYAYIYAVFEAFSGIGMLSGTAPWLFAPPALFIGTIGAISVFKAVYIDKRELKCACVGGNSNVPLGFISLTENLMMIAMGTWMLLK